MENLPECRICRTEASVGELTLRRRKFKVFPGPLDHTIIVSSCNFLINNSLTRTFIILVDRPLFFPCICTGSIKYIHQECLTQWMKYSRKEFCELCGHKFSFQPIYSPDMPRVLPLRVVAGGLVNSVATAVKYWLHYTLVAGELTTQARQC